MVLSGFFFRKGWAKCVNTGVRDAQHRTVCVYVSVFTCGQNVVFWHERASATLTPSSPP
eukprot:COSAG06_NODE_42380_length_382_cov_0.752650_1_plen_58_part_10